LAELANCHILEELNIGSIGITDDGIDHILKLKNLKKLMLFGCDNVTDAGLAKLAALKSLNALRIKHSDISIAGLNNLKSLPNLMELDVLRIKRDGATLDISDLTGLEKLRLSFGSYSEKFVDADLECLAGLKRIRWLQIGPRNFTDEGLSYLTDLTNMERLGIGGSDLTDAGLKHLTNMKKLNHLSILMGYDVDKRAYSSGGDITDEGLRQIEELKQLRFLDIYSNNTFSDTALQRLWKELPHLYTLRINGGMLLKIDSR
jgi:Leucine-rich repeat (LRR) protein